MHTIARFKGTLYPDKSFSLGVIPQCRLEGQKEDSKRLNEAEEPVYCSERLEALKELLAEDENAIGERESSLLVNSLKSSQPQRGVYGSHGITGFGKRVCKNTCILLQKKYGKECLGFGTATLPSVTRRTLEYIISKWSEITRRFLQAVKRLYQQQGEQFMYIAVTEIQEQRFAATSLPVPHLHFVYNARSSVHNGYVLDTKQFYGLWNNAVNAVLALGGLPALMGVNGHIGSVKVETIYKNAASYLGKYISKGCTVVQTMKEKGFNIFPKQWWTACMQCKKMFKESLIHLRSNDCSGIFYNLEQLLEQKLLVWGTYVDVLIRDEYVCMGAVGIMSNDMYDIYSS